MTTFCSSFHWVRFTADCSQCFFWVCYRQGFLVVTGGKDTVSCIYSETLEPKTPKVWGQIGLNYEVALILNQYSTGV